MGLTGRLACASLPLIRRVRACMLLHARIKPESNTLSVPLFLQCFVGCNVQGGWKCYCPVFIVVRPPSMQSISVFSSEGGDRLRFGASASPFLEDRKNDVHSQTQVLIATLILILAPKWPMEQLEEVYVAIHAAFFMVCV